MNKLIRKISALLLSLTMLLTIGCTSGKPNADSNTEAPSNLNNTENGSTPLSSVDKLLPKFNDKLGNSFNSVDMEGKYDSASAVSIDLGALPTSGNGISYADGELTISKSGTFILSGALNGRIIVDAGSDDRVQLVLLNAKIDSTDASAIKFKNASSGIITIPNDTDNQLSVSSTALSDAEADDGSNTHAVLSSNCSLIINGNGSVSLNSKNGNAIKCDKSLCIAGGVYSITAAKHGIRVEDECYIANGNFTLVSGSDGIHVENQTEGGNLFILNGSFNITAKGDGISTSGELFLYGGNYSVKTGDGSASVTLKSDADGDIQSGEANAVSQKGFKSESLLAIADGSFTIDTVDDSLHSGGNIGIASGKFNLRSGDDAIHSGANILIENGNFEMPYCHEGIEGVTVTIKNGNYSINSSDDGINATNGDSESNGRDDKFTPDNSCFVIIEGGCLTIVSEGDCIDSDGTLSVNGGTLDLTCGGNGNTAIDATGDYTNNGGSVTTNDGSEQNQGQKSFGGGMGGHGGHGDNGGQDRPGAPGGLPSGMPNGTPPAGLPNGTPPAGLPGGTPPAGLPNGTPPAGLPNGNFQ